ncbi:fluoride efflux transporter CrcB [Mailhella sp.]|uniref:fluoride efflux transporter CrcB n=1 Tax=Mailhella sp. TaxID=1981029 RepID=UPI00406326B9
MGSILYIALGGAAGAFLRFWSGIAAAFLFGGRFPLGTLFVNVAGSFIIGLAASAVASGRLAVHPWDDVLMLGFCGAFTTFSTFSLDTFRLCRQGRMAAAWGNLILSMALCLSAAALGLSTFPAVQSTPAVHSAPSVHPVQPESVHPVQPAPPAQF